MADSFLKDLEELCADEDNFDQVQMENEDEDIAEALKYEDDLDRISTLQSAQRFNDILRKVDDAGDELQEHLIVECNSLSLEIESEIFKIHNFIRDKYELKFPELETLIHHPVDYARVVQRIGNETDLALVDLQQLLPSSACIAVSVTASSTRGKPLPEEVLQRVMDACDRVLALDSTKERVIGFIERRMGCVAPNLSAIVGSSVAAKLVASVGGLSTLANMAACNLQLLGFKRQTTAFPSQILRVGFLEETEIFQTTPPSLRARACRVLAAKSSLAARADWAKADPEGKIGISMKEEIVKKIEKWGEEPPAKRAKPLPVPRSEAKKKRGGRRMRKRKEMYGMTEMRKMANRMAFGVAEESSLGDGFGTGTEC